MTTARLLALAACSGAFGGLAAAMPPPEAFVAEAQKAWLSEPGNMGIRVLRPEETVRPGLPTVIHFSVDRAVPFDRTVPVMIADEHLARVTGDGQVLSGQRLGYAVVEAVVGSEGKSTAQVGGQPVALTVLDVPSLTDAPRLRISAPAEGAAVWGTVGVSVTWWRPGVKDGSKPELHVGSLNGGATLKPTWANAPENGPMGLAYFEVATENLPEGLCRLGVSVPTLGETASEAEESVELHVMHPSAEALLSGECEASYDLPPLPENRKEPAPKIIDDQNASGGKYFNNAGTQPRFRFPIEVPENKPGWYQVVLTVAGDSACGAWPSIGVTVDEADRPRTSSAIAAGTWHREPIGTPIKLEPGRHVIRTDYLNDFGAGRVDRNLRLDKIEVMRVADVAAGTSTAAPGGGDPMMMSGAAGGGGGGGSDAMMAMMGGGAAGGGSAGWPANVASRTQAGVRIAFARPLEGAEIAGDLEVRTAVWWPGMGDKANAGSTPRVTLLLNGDPAGSQRSQSPRFVIPWGAFKQGENTLQLVGSSPGGGVVKTPVQHVLRPGTAPSGGSPNAALLRFTAFDPGWNAEACGLLTGEQNPPEKMCFGMMANGAITLRLPESLEGEFELDVEAKGQAFEGPPVLEASLLSGGDAPAACGTSAKLGVLKVPGGWDSHTVRVDEKSKDAATVKLGRGAKFLKLEFTNDKSQPPGADGKGGGDRNVFVQGVALRLKETPTAADSAMSVSLLYPASGATLETNGADAAVVRIAGPIAATEARVLIDGTPIGLAVDLRKRTGPYLLPVSLRGIAHGEHQLTVWVAGAAGKSFESESRGIRVGEASPGTITDYERAVVLLDRFGFGPDERELADVLTMGREEYLRTRLMQDAKDPGVAAAMELAEIRYPDSRSGGDVPRRAIFDALATTNPVRARFVLWAENHFSTWLRKVEPRRKADEHARFAHLGVAPFNDLLLASATSPAMLVYLDQAQSFARRLNENYAREIMELHTLGVHGGYTQEDVTTLAKILTGWTLAREAVSPELDIEGFEASPDEYGLADTYRYEPALGDDQPRRFLGYQLGAVPADQRYDRTLTAIRMLTGHPSTAQFIGHKIAEHYLSFPANESVAQEMASTFTRSGGDMRQLLAELSRLPQFWAIPPGKRAAHPPEFALRLSRCARSTDAGAVHEYLNLSGHGMFDRSTPDGYQENDDEIMDSNAMLQRWKFAKRLEQPLIELLPPDLRTGDKPYADGEDQRMVDLLAMRLTGRLLGAESNAAAMDLFGKTEGKRDERVRVLAVFVASCPEVQVK